MLLANADGGWIVNTASMAGFSVLPTLGGYTTSKFAVMGLSETLAAELESDGARVGVSILCPGPVRSNIKASSRNRPASLAGGGPGRQRPGEQRDRRQHALARSGRGGRGVVRAIRRGDLYALTHPEMAPQVAERHRRIAEAFAAAALPDASAA